MAHQSGHPNSSAERSATEARRFERETIRKNAILYSHDRMQSVLIRDISCGGMKIQNAFGLMPGDATRIELLTRRCFEGTVAWSVPPYCGIKFDKPLTEDDPLLPK
jgi:PilZ domain-containing protein